MSVEEVTETTQEVETQQQQAQPDEAKDQSSREDSMHTATSEESSVKTSLLPGETEEEELLSGSVKLRANDSEGSSAARKWFENLSSEDRQLFLGFTDGAFVAAMCGGAPSSMPTSVKEGGEAPDAAASSTGWKSEINMKHFEQTYLAFEKRKEEVMKSDAVVGDVSAGFDDDEAAVVDEVTVVDVENDEAVVMEENNKSSSTTDTKQSLVGDNTPGPTDSSNEGSQPPSRRAEIDFSQSMTLCDQACAVFPAALQHATGDSHDGHIPFITVHPSYVNTKGDEEILSALDSVATTFLGSRFLCYDFDAAPDIGQASWMDRFAGGGVAQVPLHSILVARFEWAVVTAFREEREARFTQLGPIGLGVSYSAEARSRRGVESREEEESSAEQYASAQETESSTEGKDSQELVVTTVCRRRTQLAAILVHFGHACEFDEANDRKALERVVLPFTRAFFLEGSVPRRTQDVILTPVAWLLQVGHLNEGILRFDVLNDAVRSSLRLMIDPISVSCDAKLPSLVQESGVEDPGAADASAKPTNGDTPATGKKKRKKKKKKKSPKVSNVDAIPKDVESLAVPSQKEVVSVVEKDKEELEPEVEPVAEAVICAPPPPPPHQEIDESEATTCVPDLASVKSDASVPEEKALSSASIPSGKGGITISTGVVVVAAPMTDSGVSPVAPGSEDAASSLNKAAENDEEAWETVEVRGRGNRRKSSERIGAGARSVQHSVVNVATSEASASGSKKSKGTRTTTRKQKNPSRRIVRDVLNTILDTVDEEVQKRRQCFVPSPVVNAWKVGPPGLKPASGVADLKVPEPVASASPPKTLRDVLLGKPKKALPLDSAGQDQRLPRVDEKIKMRESPARRQSSPLKAAVLQRGKAQVGTAADQNTAPTYQETVSAVSTSSNAALDSKECHVDVADPASKDDLSSGGTEDAPPNKGDVVTGPSPENVSPTPPLPTLLSPENANSATSSVASSLEAPHAGHRHHHSNSAVDVNDVGYHLLDVCDRLSRDMSLFMSRRALALNERRRERGALLAALQDSVSSIWPGRCHVEMYGSCATQLDLPSSDLDVVILGLDRNLEMMMAPSVTPQSIARSQSVGGESVGTSASMDEANALDENYQHVELQRHISVAPYVPIMHRNAERVMRLAAKLEGQAWAVQVNAIPTASVPVIKILADPSRLDGSSNGGDWMSHRQHLAAQAAAAASQGSGRQSGEGVVDNNRTGDPYGPKHTILPWRGSDVVNGLLKLDITFEGPEHGGIGSTDFSGRIVGEFCHESGLYPDATPFVQVLMVMKELLAQRKLNEPYSGGLSSYALLLLLVALLRERAVIREEIDRVEKQKQAMSSGDPDAAFGGSPGKPAPKPQQTDVAYQRQRSDETPVDATIDKNSSAKEPSAVSPQVDMREARPQHAKKNGKKTMGKVVEQPTQAQSPAVKLKPVSSWASIARKNTNNPGHAKSLQESSTGDDGSQRQDSKRAVKPPSQKPSTFADAVARSVAQAPATLSVSSSVCSERKLTRGKGDPGVKKPEPVNTTVSLTTVASSGATGAVETPKESTPSADHPSMGEGVRADSSLANAPVFPQGFNDVIEVLCTGETTAGKLLMHFLLYYGEHFDAQTTAIDISGKHERDYLGHALLSYAHFSPYIQRRAPGSIDPVTGMLIVDPIVIFDPLEGAENNNVARRCYAWNSVRWIFAQSYATLSSAVERSATPPSTPGGKALSTARPQPGKDDGGNDSAATHSTPGAVGDLMDPSSPLLRCLLSF